MIHVSQSDVSWGGWPHIRGKFGRLSFLSRFLKYANGPLPCPGSPFPSKLSVFQCFSILQLISTRYNETFENDSPICRWFRVLSPIWGKFVGMPLHSRFLKFAHGPFLDQDLPFPQRYFLIRSEFLEASGYSVKFYGTHIYPFWSFTTYSRKFSKSRLSLSDIFEKCSVLSLQDRNKLIS